MRADDPVDDGRRYLLTTTAWPDPSPHTITVYGSADLARRVWAAHAAGVCVSFRRLDESETAVPR